MAEQGGIGFEGVLAGIEIHEVECAVPGGGGSCLDACGLISQHDSYAGKWRRMQVGQVAALLDDQCVPGAEQREPCRVRQRDGCGVVELASVLRHLRLPATSNSIYISSNSSSNRVPDDNHRTLE